MIVLDGAMGEGGGQILRSALSLSLVTGQPFRLENVRANRKKPGLMRQHRAAVRAAARVGRAEVRGDEVGSSEVSFEPRGLEAGEITLEIGSAGSTTLVLQTVLPALLRAPGPSVVTIEGGTHNPLAPPFEFLEQAFAPVLARMGARVELELVRHGFAPAGGGRLVARIDPSALCRLSLEDRGPLESRCATALISALPGDVAERELARVRERIGLGAEECRIRGVRLPIGPGNALTIALRHREVTEVVTAFGERGRPAEAVADEACDAALAYLAHDAPVGELLADQLLLPCALAGGGVFRATVASSHARTQAALIPRFLPRITVEIEELGERGVRFVIR